MDPCASSIEPDCARAAAQAPLWLAGSLVPSERKSFGAHVSACPACESDLRARLALRAASCDDAAPPDPSRRSSTGGKAWLAAGVSRLRAGRGVLLLACLGGLLLASFERARRAPRIDSVVGSALRDGAPARSGEELRAGSIVVVPPDSSATLACGGLHLEIQGPGRLRAKERGFDLLAGAARVVGVGTVGTSRGALLCEDARVDLVESAEGFELHCADGAVRLSAVRTHSLGPGGRLRFAGSSPEPELATKPESITQAARPASPVPTR